MSEGAGSGRRAALIATAAVLVLLSAIILLRHMAAGDEEKTSNSVPADSAIEDDSTSTRVKRRVQQAGSNARETKAGAKIAVPGTEGSSPLYPDEAKDALAVAFDSEKPFADAEKEFGVPANLLKAIAYVETSGQYEPGIPNNRGGRGVMGLKNTPQQPMIQRAAQLLATDSRSIVIDPVQNIRAAAALLKYFRASSPTSKATWAQAVERYSGDEPAAAAEYQISVRETLSKGVSATSQTADLNIPGSQSELLDQ